jgi:hypothetical protein
MAAEERLWIIERFIAGVDELKTVLGRDTAPVVERAKQELVRAAAARDRGDRDGTLAALSRAMAELATLGDRLGGNEGTMMRAVTNAFVQSLARDDRDAVEASLALIQSQAGTPKKKGPA